MRIVILLAGLILVFPSLVLGGYRDDPILVVHLQPRSAKGFCTTSAPTNLWCDDNGNGNIGASGAFNTSYDAYHVLLDVDPKTGVLGVNFGISYSESIRSFGWESCGDMELPRDGWPESGGGNLISFAECQSEGMATDPEGDAGVVLGTIYMYAYSDGIYQITESPNPTDRNFEYVDCEGTEHGLREFISGGWVGFGIFRGRGCGLPLCSAVERNTWGNVKRVLGSADSKSIDIQPN